MTIDAPLELYRDKVRPEWIDYNGHMNVAYYVLAFDYATDAFFDHIGLDDPYRAESGNSTFAVEAHLTYQREVAEGDPLRFTTQLLGFDDKRLHFVHRMYHAGEDFLAATSEWLSLHVDMTLRRVAPMPAQIQARFTEVMASHRSLAIPPEAGRVIKAPGDPG
jgi:acyl-CoA thioester hydrolase